jgi:hypothetical protein
MATGMAVSPAMVPVLDSASNTAVSNPTFLHVCVPR